jgi:DNA polymerase III alpha subunit
MMDRGYTQDFAERCFEQIKGFSEYGFPESHAASFALLVYASAWLKRHHPAAFAAALINSQPMGFYAPAQIVRDAHQRRLATAGQVADSRHGQWIRAAGLVTCRQRPSTASGVLFVTLEDETGYVNLVVWSDLVEKNRATILRSRLLAVAGKVQREGLVVHVLAQRFRDLTPMLGELRTQSHDFH